MKVDVGYFTNAPFDKQAGGRLWEVEEEEMAAGLAKALKALRLWHGYSLKKVSEQTDIPFQTIARYENGENVPSVIQAYKLAYFYQFSINDMFLLGLFENIENDYRFILDHWDKPSFPKK